MYVVLVEFIIRPGHEDAFMTAVRRQAFNSLTKEERCRRFDVCVDPANPRSVWLYELYDTEADFGVHRASDHFHDFDTTVKDLVENKTVRLLALQEALQS